MNIEKLKEKLCKYGTVQLVKEGYVFTVLITGSDLSNFDTVNKITSEITSYASKKYSNIEAMVNDKEFYCLILKP